MSNLLDELTKAGIDYHVDTYDEIHIRRGPFAVRISKRNHYCDRGRWLVHAESSDCTQATVDHSDMFPRYYFHAECLAKELSTWLDTRMRNINAENTW